MNLSACPSEEVNLSMTNVDHSIDDGLEEALKAGSVFGRHAGWNFNGKVWWDGEQFVEEVWRYRTLVATMRAETLRELMTKVNNDWGWD